MAKQLLNEMENGKYGALIISDYVFDETMTMLKKYLGSEKACEKGEAILKSLELVMIDSQIFQKSWHRFGKFNKLSFTDCTIIETMECYTINYLATFDSDFEGIVKMLV